ncbi:MAG: hypothetical protein AAFY20_09235 [Cyanobacteria bacterium J06639_14]
MASLGSWAVNNGQHVAGKAAEFAHLRLHFNVDAETGLRSLFTRFIWDMRVYWTSAKPGEFTQ